MANEITLLLPDDAGPGPWVDATALGPGPLAQMSVAATAEDTCHLETAASVSATTGGLIEPLKGGNGPTALPKPMAFLRAVRDVGSTPGLSVTVTQSTSAGVAGPPGPSGPAGPQSASAPLVWKPGAPAGSPPNVFPTWAALYAASLPHSKVIADDSLVPGGIQFPAGSWPNIDELAGVLTQEQVRAVTLDGAVFPNCTKFSDNIHITTRAITVSPFPLPDDTTLIFNNAGMSADPTSTLPSILATPGSGATGPQIELNLGGTIASAGLGSPPTIGISPLVPGANNVSVLLNGGALASDTVGGLGPNAASSALTVFYLSESSFIPSGTPMTQLPSLASLALDDATATQTGQFAADVALVAPGATAQVVPAFGNTTTLLVGPSIPKSRALRMNAPGIKTFLDLELTGSGANDGNVAVVQLTKNGAPVPGATLTIAISTNTTVHALVGGFQSGHVAGDTYNLLMTPVQAIPGPAVFHNISGSLR
jgi:hypothetical protein